MAMKKKDAITKNTIQMIRAAILQTEKDKKIELDDNAILEIVSKQVKQKAKSMKTVSFMDISGFNELFFILF